MVKFVDRVKMNLTTTGTGAVTFGSVVSGFQSLSDASVVNADTVRYTIESGNNYESGTGTIGLTGSTYTMSRSPSSSSESNNSAIDVASGSVCFLTILAEDIVQNLADLGDVSSTSPSGGQTLSWDLNTSTWSPTSPAGGIASVSNYAGLPSSPSATDLAWVSDQNSLYIYDGSEWDRVSTGSQVSPRFTTTPPSTLTLDTSANSTLTAVAVDDAGFPITYDWDGFSGSTLYSASSLPPQLTAVSESSGVFSLTASTNSSHSGNFTFRTKASDGVLTTTANTSVTLTFGLSDCYGFSLDPGTTGFFIVYYMLLDESGVNMFDDSTFRSDCTQSATQYNSQILAKDTTDSSEAAASPGYFVAQQNALFGTSPADATAFHQASGADGTAHSPTITWTTPRTIGAIMISGYRPTGANYWLNWSTRAFIGGSTASDLSSTYTLTTSTQTGFTDGNAGYFDFTA